jgi:acyl dehydratase
METQTEGALVTSLAELAQHTHRRVGPTAWQPMSQERVDRFADVTNDHNFIHVDPVRARATAFGGTIAHGFLTLSLLAPVSQELIVVTDAVTSLNYGLNKVRFPAPLRVGAEFRGVGEILEVAPLTGGAQVTAVFSIEVAGSTKPVLVAECLLRYYA